MLARLTIERSAAQVAARSSKMGEVLGDNVLAATNLRQNELL
jgi:hypothetical protein